MYYVVEEWWEEWWELQCVVEEWWEL